MTFTIALAWWAIPTTITIVSLMLAIFWRFDDGHGFLSSLGNILLLVPALIVSVVAWIICGMLK